VAADHEHEHEHEHEHGGDVPEGAAVFPEIPAELNVHPLLLAVLHATVFLAGSDDAIVQPDAGEEALQCVADYLQRLTGPDLRRAREDMDALLAYAKQQGWPKQLQHFLTSFLADFGVGAESDA
jgi:hypothetical protein